MAGKSVEIPKGAIESTETLMEDAKIADKLDDMTDDLMENSSAGDGGIAKAIESLTPHVDVIEMA